VNRYSLLKHYAKGSPDMKKPIRTTKITVETERTFIFRNSSGQQPGWCVTCGSEALMTTVAGAAREAGLSEFALYQLLDSRALHFSEDAEGRVLVCLNSLLN
jgi:hypothetical protein